MSQVQVRPLATLPTTTLPWLTLRDHFVATVGPRAGEGAPLGPLLVLADATFAPRSRFPLHPHADMEILSLVLEGELSHHGDQAQGATLGPREAQLISARRGIVHAEGNDTDRSTRMLQIWLRPDAQGGEPVYTQRRIERGGRRLIAGDAGMPLRCDARAWWIDLAPGAEERLAIAAGRRGYLLALDAPLRLPGGVGLAAGEGATLGPGELAVRADAAAAVLLLDVPG